MTSTIGDDAVTLERARRLSVLLALTDEPPRPMAFPAGRVALAAERRTRRLAWRWRAAAAALVVLVGATAVPPVRALITGAARSVWHRLGGGPDAAPPAPAPAPRHAAANAVSFPAPADAIVLRVATRQAAGLLTIESADGGDVTAAQTAPGAAEFVVLPDGLRILNHRGDTAGYRLRVPSSLVRVTVLIGGEPARVLHPGAADRWSLSLTEAARAAR